MKGRMKTFDLEVQLSFDDYDGSKNDSSQQENVFLEPLNKKGTFSQDSKLYVVQGTFTSITPSVGLAEGSCEEEGVRMAAIFVPDTLVESALLGMMQSHVATPPPSHALSTTTTADFHRNSLLLDTKCTVNEILEKEYLSRLLLGMIHPYLGQNFVIRYIISIRKNERHAPSDLVLIDLSHAPEAAVDDLLHVINGQTIHSGREAVLKILLISNVNFVTETKRTTNDTSNHIEIPNCPVCLHRIDPLWLGLPRPENQHLCSKFCASTVNLNSSSTSFSSLSDVCPKQSLILPWPLPSKCVVCNVVQRYWKGDLDDEKQDLFCSVCALQETLWVCMTCGFVGCGRYSNKHAAQHFDESGHCFSLELATLRIWEYVHSSFAHRADLLECPTSLPKLHPWASRKPRHNVADGESDFSSPQIDKSTKKTTMVGEEYEALLQSALEDQEQHFEGEIARLQTLIAQDGVDMGSMSKDQQEEVSSLKEDLLKLQSEIQKMSRSLLKAQDEERKHRQNSQALLREQQASEELIQKVRNEIDEEQIKGRTEIDDLEQQIQDLTANQSLRQQFTDNEELANAQIYGTSGEESRKKGKKKRNFFRK